MPRSNRRKPQRKKEQTQLQRSFQSLTKPWPQPWPQKLSTHWPSKPWPPTQEPTWSLVAAGWGLAALGLLLFMGTKVQASASDPQSECQQIIQSNVVLSREQLAELLTIPERSAEQRFPYFFSGNGKQRFEQDHRHISIFSVPIIGPFLFATSRPDMGYYPQFRRAQALTTQGTMLFHRR
ncbi:hypothetical protein [Leptothoe sp. PORK10 BA2]|uniref:hypothetical protein n=1 Tax=Leptothoe sp. PORK10 BA2 TaxID=3110254 RepID=UPI002B2140AD|nr:hypothetical protein [Leptothoe sp. PORK10 BA2]MEA5466298.1 hypothetical protein [Leptothoe sp. PORK10 BA2]